MLVHAMQGLGKQSYLLSVPSCSNAFAHSPYKHTVKMNGGKCLVERTASASHPGGYFACLAGGVGCDSLHYKLHILTVLAVRTGDRVLRQEINTGNLECYSLML